MTGLFFPKDLLEVIMLLIDDPPTYGSFARCSRFTASIARKHLRRRQRELKDLLPPLTLRSNLDTVRERLKIVTVTDNQYGLLGSEKFFLKDEYVLSNMPIQVHNGGQLPGYIRQADIVEIHVENDMEILIGGTSYIVTRGILSIPVILIPYHDVVTKSACKIQCFFFSSEEHNDIHVLMPSYQRIGDYVLVYSHGMVYKVDPAYKIDLKPYQLIEGFHYVKEQRSTGIFHVKISDKNSETINHIYSDISSCSDVINVTKPLTFNPLIIGVSSYTYFTITTRVIDSVINWLLTKQVNVRVSIDEIREDVTPKEIIEAQKRDYIEKKLQKLKKFVDIGLLENFE